LGKVFDTRSQDGVDSYLEMFDCLSAEQTVIAVRKAKFWGKTYIVSLATYIRHLLMKLQKNWRPYKILLW